ncbi:MAG: hypothetical protein HND47_17510 [Chloroflexi bacterium]|nr:hypothetical protein [Chloroflexota bacterium]
MNFPVLSIITFLPFAAGALILMMPAARRNETRAIALAAAAIDLLLSGWVYIQYLLQGMSGYQFLEQYNWLPQLGITLYFGVDGMSAPLVLLTGIVMFTGVLISWGDDDKHVLAGIQGPPARVLCLPLRAGGRRVRRVRLPRPVHAVLLL